MYGRLQETSQALPVRVLGIVQLGDMDEGQDTELTTHGRSFQ
jgi:hypothetical protein